MRVYIVRYRGEWDYFKVEPPGKLSHPLNSTKKAEEMIMSSIVWSHSKDILHLAALKIHLVIAKF